MMFQLATLKRNMINIVSLRVVSARDYFIIFFYNVYKSGTTKNRQLASLVSYHFLHTSGQT